MILNTDNLPLVWAYQSST